MKTCPSVSPYSAQPNAALSTLLDDLKASLLARIAEYVDISNGDAEFDEALEREDDAGIVAAYRCPDDTELRFRLDTGSDASASEFSVHVLLAVCEHLDLGPAA